ncbi:MAG: hypothetical protein EXX96DRAFT_519681 [Benjaminiella poitrasii]|nr:MAG: hypothetical protein EXX96DRAFT_519681 [Benjaminiella poitrasii]
MSDISFEHFDPELELCNLDENGRPIRPRKKPGRKPNPPSPAQRKAQNRAAQRAFRERKRREMREAEKTVQKCLYAREKAMRESGRLRRRVKELEFETNYLKGYTLTLKLVCIANNIEVPKFWDCGRGKSGELGAEEMAFSRTQGIPQPLELFLDKNMNIISITEDDNDDDSEEVKVQNMKEQDLFSPPSSILSSSYLVDDEKSSFSSLSSVSSHETSDDGKDEMIDAKTGIIRAVTMDYDTSSTKSDGDHSSSSTVASAPDHDTSFDKKCLPPMVPLEAIKQMRAIKNLDENARALFKPTELQRNIRHDTRIDVVPGAALRDHMILFQDFYDANELFCYLAESSVFLGGHELGNPDAWFVSPHFYRRYWFLCPNHDKQERIDNAAEIMVNVGQRMMTWMTKRKQMYVEREYYAEHFPLTTVDGPPSEEIEEGECLFDDPQPSSSAMELFPLEDLTEQDLVLCGHDGGLLLTEDNRPQCITLLANDSPLEQFITLMN